MRAFPAGHGSSAMTSRTRHLAMLLLAVSPLVPACRGTSPEPPAGPRVVVQTDAGPELIGADEFDARVLESEDRCAEKTKPRFVRAYRYDAFFDGRARPDSFVLALEIALEAKDDCFDALDVRVRAGEEPLGAERKALHLTDTGQLISRADRDYDRLAGRHFVVLSEFARAVPSVGLGYGRSRRENMLVAESGPTYPAMRVQVSALTPEGDAAGKHWWAFFDAVDIARADHFLLVAGNDSGEYLPCVQDGTLDLDPKTGRPRTVDEAGLPLIEPWRHGVVRLICPPKIRIARIGRQFRALQTEFDRTPALSPAARTAIRTAFDQQR